jgi:hypothetical protein
MYLQGIALAQPSRVDAAVGAEVAMATDGLALGAIVRQNIGMSEDEGD